MLRNEALDLVLRVCCNGEDGGDSDLFNMSSKKLLSTGDLGCEGVLCNEALDLVLCVCCNGLDERDRDLDPPSVKS